MKIKQLLLLTLLVLANLTFAQEKPMGNAKKPGDKANAPDTSLFNYKLSITDHVSMIGGKSISYTATTGYMPILDEHGHHKGDMFFIAYTKKGVKDMSKRPITFAFNGGPGSSSVWLHMGALGPVRVKLTPDGNAPAPPYSYEDNQYSWLDLTDLVFIDPVGTGYSRPSKGTKKKEFDGYKQDIHSVGDFIRLYTTKYERWGSPKFLAGESYGTTRAAGLSGYLQHRYGMYLNGIILQSSVLNFEDISFDVGNDLPYVLFLPTYTATAWYHKKLSPALQAMPLDSVLRRSEHFAEGEYASALMMGDQLSAAKHKEIAQKLAMYTGLSEKYVDESNLRVMIWRFNKELLRDQRRTIGRYDSRIIGIDRDAAGGHPTYDPSYNNATLGPFTAAFNEYVRQDLNYKNDLPYEILSSKVWPWDYSNVENQYLNVSETLRQAMTENPHLKVMFACGYYDLATPYFSAEYTIHHMQLDSSLTHNISIDFYKSGHMLYINQPSLIKYKKDVKAFIESAK